jgi:hypothetical protein
MTIVQEVKKIIPSKLDDKAKAVYNRLKEETNNFDIEFLVVYTDLEKAVEQFVDVVKKKYPDAIRVVRKKEKPTPPPTPEPETDDKEVLEVIRDYRISESQAKRLVQLRRDASESKKESIDKMLDTLKKSEFYNARYTSKQNIDKNRTRDIKKDSNRGSLTAKDELNMTGKRYKRISKAGHKNQYGTTEGGKVYYEYRANRRDIDHKIELANGGALKGRFKKHFNRGGMIDLFIDYENIPPKIQEILDFYEEDFQDGRYDGLSKALKEVEANGYTFEYYLDGEAYGLRPINVPLNHIKGYEDEDYAKGGGVGKFKYERGQKFQDQYGEIILLDKYSDGLWEARRWSGMRHVGDVVISEKDLDLIRTKKMAKGGGVGSKNLFDLEYGDVFKINKAGHTASNMTFVYVDLDDKYNVSIKARPFPIGSNKRNEFVYITDIQDGDIQILSEEEVGKIYLNYNIDKNKFAEGDVIKGGVEIPNTVAEFKAKMNDFVKRLNTAESLWKLDNGKSYNNIIQEREEYYKQTRRDWYEELSKAEVSGNMARYNVLKKMVNEAFKFENGGGVEGRFKKHFKKGGSVKATYIPNASIKSLTTKYGSTIKGQDLLDGVYTTRKNVKLEPKVDRFMFEDEMYEYAKGGWVLYDEDSQEAIRTYKTESEARENLYEYEGNANIVKKSIWDKTYEPKVDRFMFEEEMYEYKKGGRVSEDVYYDMLGAVPPLYISELNGVKQSGNTTFAVGEAYDYMNTPNGFKSVYQAFSQKGKFYYNEGLIYFTERGVAKSIKE